MTKIINENLIEAIEMYQKLNIEGKIVQTPYFINSNRTRDLRAMIGKGTPEEIVMEAKIWAKLKGFNFSQSDSNQIKIFLQDQGIGIDCSGFIVNILNIAYKKSKRRSIWHKFKSNKSSFYSKIKFMLRPVENLGADFITNSFNTTVVNLKDILPGDLIRSKSIKINGDHVMVVTQVEYDNNNLPVRITYAHSTPNFGSESGVKFGEIKITQIEKGLEAQEWLEVDSNGDKPTFEGFLQNSEDNGIRRLNFFKELE